MTLLRGLTFLLGFQTVIFIVLLFWIDFFLLMLVDASGILVKIMHLSQLFFHMLLLF